MIFDFKNYINEKASSNESLLAFKLLNAWGPDEKKEEKSFEKFADNRFKGAFKISQNANEKGGDSLLTWHHFRVKLPYYEKAIKGKFDPEEAEEQLEEKLKSLTKGLSGSGSLSQVDFQKVMGEIEVLGELLLKFKSLK